MSGCEARWSREVDKSFGSHLALPLVLLSLSCASATSEPESAAESADEPEPAATFERSAQPQPPIESEPAGPEQPEPTEPEQAEIEPEFEPGMTVSEAMNAVPEGAERLNVEQEVLAAPLLKPELYEPCNLKSHHHFTVRVAIWDGRVVGMDLTTKPQNEKLEQCLRTQIGALTWEDKAPSLNTVEYSF